MNYLLLFLLFFGCLIFFFFSTKRKLLTPNAALTAIVFGLWVVSFAGLLWLIPLFVFFGSSALIGKLLPVKAESTDKKHGKPRDYFQVICNGLPYVVCATFFESAPDLIALMMGTSMAAATSDTWSSEIGIYFKGKTFDIFKMKPVPPGVSGGMSRYGTLAGIFGSVLIAVICSFIFFEKFNPMYFKVVAFFGFVGMCLDSLLGSVFQIKYQKEGVFSDTKSAGSVYQSGYQWMTNDMVNLWSNGIIIMITALFFVWMG